MHSANCLSEPERGHQTHNYLDPRRLIGFSRIPLPRPSPRALIYALSTPAKATPVCIRRSRGSSVLIGQLIDQRLDLPDWLNLLGLLTACQSLVPFGPLHFYWTITDSGWLSRAS
ncbi:hypothetical protein VTL71DRAFT_4463 [Oculimacula yallundae]|uniref:Uncharacterized protein n=1 Tax=Oculimacula yallundae TaxID=86028 RepID=A0ABR4C234_9HELO